MTDLGKKVKEEARQKERQRRDAARKAARLPEKKRKGK